ncbi:hypothetical protein XAUB_03840 [Xanthomonas citri pv. aurantifolii str. ICPB 11122]|nr:hypothetical protein XAUB_03840 [Xanthomonas citri pv. aurantifolii str. ICPB 11122]
MQRHGDQIVNGPDRPIREANDVDTRPLTLTQRVKEPGDRDAIIAPFNAEHQVIAEAATLDHDIGWNDRVVVFDRFHVVQTGPAFEDLVGAMATTEDICVRPAFTLKCVVSCPTHQPVIAQAAIQRVVTGPTKQNIVATVAVHGVVACTAIHTVRTAGLPPIR